MLRYAQESVASLCGSDGFGVAPPHNGICRRLGKVATDPTGEVIEYVKRDVAERGESSPTLATVEKLLRPMGMTLGAVPRPRPR